MSASLTAEEILLEPQDVVEEPLSHPEDRAAARGHRHQKEKQKEGASSLERKSIMNGWQSIRLPEVVMCFAVWFGRLFATTHAQRAS